MNVEQKQQLEKYLMSNGLYDIGAIRRDVQSDLDEDTLDFMEFFGEPDSETGESEDTPELVKLALRANEATNAEQNATKERRARQLLIQIGAATNSQKIWHELADLGYANLIGNGEDAYFELKTNAKTLIGAFRPDPYGDQIGIDEEVSLDVLMTKQEVAETFGIHRQTVQDAIDAGYIDARQSGKTWLIRRVDAESRWGKKS